MTEFELRTKVVSIAKSWLGLNEKDGSFKSIIDIYNTQKPLPRGYKLKYTDEWCAGTITAIGIKAGLSDIIFGECSCTEMIKKYQKSGRWEENDAYTPSIGDIIMYYWKDGTNYAVTDCTSNPNHVGIVSQVLGTTLIIIEGNKGESVSYRTMQVNGRYIRGYCLPDYASKATKNNQTQEEDEEMPVTYEKLGDVPSSYRPAVQKLMEKGVLNGYSDPDPSRLDDNVINVTEDMCRVFTILNNLGKLD